MWPTVQSTMQHIQRAALVLLLAPQLLNQALGQYLLHSFSGAIGSENYTYYKLGREGPVSVVLHSLEGDADLYISDKTLLPDFENYELQSTTCGEDQIDIPATFRRPVGIGVYGHPSHRSSKFLIEVYVENSKYIQPRQPHHQHRGSPGKEDEEESVLWAIFVSILKIILDILV